MKRIVPILFTSIGGLLGSLYGYLSVLALIPALIASDIPVPLEFGGVYRARYLYGLLPVVLISGGLIGRWRAGQIEALGGWQKWGALILLSLIVAVLGYAASFGLFLLSA
ncbi:MAG: hypothetical protein PVJ21_20545 [Anaerolineales bacterium]|jgi:hypothetical protein